MTCFDHVYLQLEKTQLELTRVQQRNHNLQEQIQEERGRYFREVHLLQVNTALCSHDTLIYLTPFALPFMSLTVSNKMSTENLFLLSLRMACCHLPIHPLQHKLVPFSGYRN